MTDQPRLRSSIDYRCSRPGCDLRLADKRSLPRNDLPRTSMYADPYSLRKSWIIWYAIVLHAWWGVALLALDIPLGDEHGGVGWNVYFTTLGEGVTAWLMLFAAFTALVGIFSPKHWAWLLLVPQQTMLAIGAFSIFLYLFGWAHSYDLSRIMRVAPMSLGIFIFHTLAICEHFGCFRWRRR